MRLDKLIMAFLVFSVILVTGVMLIQDVNTNYGLNMSTEEFSNTYNTINETYDLAQDMEDHTLGGELDDAEPWESSVKGSYSAIRMVKNVYELYNNIINDIAETLHIPSFFIKFAIAALTIFIVFAIIYLFMRFKP